MIVTAAVDGWSFHKANDCFVEEWGGLGSPEVREVRGPAPRRHGAWDATTLYGPRLMPVKGWCGQVPSGAGDPEAAAAAFDLLKSKFWIENEHTVTIRRPGRAADEQMEVRLAGPIEGVYEGGGSVIRWSADLIAPDPLLYGTVLNTAVGTANTGITIPTVGGTVPTPAILEVRGPLTAGGTLSFSHDGKAINLSGVPALATYTAGSSDVLLVYLGDRTVEYLGNARPQDVLAATTDWWRLVPGSSVAVSMTGTARQAGTRLAVYWREARI